MSTTLRFLVLAFTALNTVTALNQTPSAKVRNGTITGVHSSPYDQDFFLGIPYAQPPVGNLRYRVPQSLNSTFITRAATAYSPFCVGYGVSIGFVCFSLLTDFAAILDYRYWLQYIRGLSYSECGSTFWKSLEAAPCACMVPWGR